MNEVFRKLFFIIWRALPQSCRQIYCIPTGEIVWVCGRPFKRAQHKACLFGLKFLGVRLNSASFSRSCPEECYE